MSTVSTERRSYGHIIDGEELPPSDKSIVRHNPATGAPVARFAAGTGDDVRAAAAAARAAFDYGPWPRMSGAERSRALLRIAQAIGIERERLARIDAEEVGKPVRLARGDLDAAVAHFEYAAALAHECRGDGYTNLGPQYLGLVLREPVGVAGLIGPWNFPAVSYAEKVPYALAAGCTVVLKPSEFTSGSSLEITKLATEAGLPGGVVNVVTGNGADAGQALVESPDVDFMSFTGSTATGRTIAAAAALTTKRVSLELGGKGANVVFADADLDDAVDGALFAVFFKTGECCVAGSRLLVEESIADGFVDRLAARTRALRVGLPFDEQADIGALIHERHMIKVLAYMESAKGDGARAVTGGTRLKGEYATGWFVAPTIFDGVAPHMAVFREEICGPVLTITRFRGIEDAIALANDTDGLGNSVWTKNVDKALTFSRALRSGTVWVNTTVDSGPQMPFGGIKASGYGRETGRAGLEEYTQLKSCVVWTGKREPFYS